MKHFMTPLFWLFCTSLYAQIPPTRDPHFFGETQPVPQDGLTYDQYVGETISGISPANGWRTDTLNLGYNKTVYWNPYIALLDVNRFEKQTYGPPGEESYHFYLYANGKKYSGQISDTLISHYTGESFVFSALCVDGMVQGEGTLTAVKENKRIATRCFVDGEMMGECKKKGAQAKQAE